MNEELEKELAQEVQDQIVRTPPRVDDLLAQGVRQLSRKYRTVARLPPGMTGLQALKERAPQRYEEVMRRAEEWAAETYCRYEAQKHGDQFDLSNAEFNEYLAKTGRCPNNFLERNDLQQCPHCKTLGHIHARGCPGDPKNTASKNQDSTDVT